jgi:hypothetical protein
LNFIFVFLDDGVSEVSAFGISKLSGASKTKTKTETKN